MKVKSKYTLRVGYDLFSWGSMKLLLKPISEPHHPHPGNQNGAGVEGKTQERIKATSGTPQAAFQTKCCTIVQQR